MARFRKIFYLLLFLSVSLTAQFDNIKFEHITVEHGLSHGNVHSIIQDQFGFMWFGTADGLNKYDGYRVTLYKHDPADSFSISSNKITSLYEDKSGALWIGTVGGGLNRFDHEKEKFIRYPHDPNNSKSISSHDMQQIVEFQYDEQNILWIGTYNGLNKMDLKTEIFTHYPPTNEGFPINYVEATVVDSLGIVWIGCTGGLHRFDPKTEQYTHYQHDPQNPNSLSNDRILSLYIDKLNNLWIGTLGGGLNKFEPEQKRFLHYKQNPHNKNSLSDNFVLSIFEDRVDNLWIGTASGGLNKFEHETEQFSCYQYDPVNQYSLSDNTVMCTYVDRSGVFWVGTRSGVNKFDLQKSQFSTYKLLPKNSDSPSSNYIWSLYESSDEDKEVIWIGTKGAGLVKLDRGAGKYTHYLHDPDNSNSISSNLVSALYQDRSGILWIGTWGFGLNKFDLKSGQFKCYIYNPADENSISSNIITSIYEDKSGLIWVTTQIGGLNKLNRESGRFTRVGRSIQIGQVLEDKSDEFWLATGLGLKKLDRETGQFKTYWHNPDDPNSISNNSVISIYESQYGEKNVLWIGTKGGLNKFNRTSQTFTCFRQKDGLSNDVINGILEDNNGNLWLSTNIGLSKFNPKSERFRNYYSNDGLVGDQFIIRSYFKSKKSELFFGSVNGFTSFYPDQIKDNPYIPEVVLTEFQIFNERIEVNKNNGIQNEDVFTLPKHISLLDEIVLSHEQSVFSFEFASLDYHSQQKNRYAYLMEGVDPNWVYTDASRHFATYTNLDPGEYIFRVKGSNNDGIWNEEGTTIKITITPPWWQTNLAYSFYALLIGLMVFGVWRFQTNRLKMRHQMEMDHLHTEKLEEVDRLKSRFFANISHEFRTPLTLILGPVEQMFSGEFKGNFKEQYKVIIRNARRLLQLINQLLDLSKLESGKLKLQAQAIEIISFTNGLVQAFESLAVRKNITLKFKTDLDAQEVYFDVEKFEKIINNLLSNAFKFTPEGGVVKVEVSLRGANQKNGDTAISKKIASLHNSARNDTNSQIQIQVSNTGPGIPADRIDKIFDRFYQVDDSYTKDGEGTGIGLALTKELVDLHNGEIFAKSVLIGELGSGEHPPSPLSKGEVYQTTFSIQLPLGKEHLKEKEIIDIPPPKISSLTKEGLRGVPENAEDSPLKKGARELSKSDIETAKFEGNQEITETEKQKDLLVILIVEDNAEMRHYIRNSMLAHSGDSDYKIIEAENGEEGLTIATKEIPDLIISDVMMPKMDGFEFCTKIKTDERTSHIPLILLTARADMESKIEGLEFGADDYVTKPFDAKELSVRSKNLLEQRRRLREHFKREVDIHPSEITVNSMDEQFMQRAIELIEQYIDDTDFSVERFSQEMGMSSRNLSRKLHALTNYSTQDFIRIMRLKRAAQLLQKKSDPVTQIAYQVGFNNPAYFAQCFRKQFGMSPSEYTTLDFK